MEKPSHVHTDSSQKLAILPLLIALIVGLSIPTRGEPPVEDPSKAPPQACLLPMDVEKIQNTALTELLKLRPELKADDLKVCQLMYILTPDPDYAFQEEKDGTWKKIYLSANHQELAVSFTILHTAHAGTADNRPTTVHDTVSVNFPSARDNEFSVSGGTSTQYR